MIAAAVTLFARAGFNGVTAKEIAHGANVSDGNIFRYFPTKRDLFLCALDSELQKLSNCVEDIARIKNAEDSRTALRAVLELITATMVKQPELVRLLHFSALEFTSDIEPIFRRHVYPIFEALAAPGQKWACDDDSRGASPMTTVVFFIATVILMQDFLPSFAGCPLPIRSTECVAAYAELWCQVISTPPKADALTATAVAGTAP
jgi:AcrR family transcriptional regulator